MENSPAAEKGILKGDKILFLDGKDVRDYEFGSAVRRVYSLQR